MRRISDMSPIELRKPEVTSEARVRDEVDRIKKAWPAENGNYRKQLRALVSFLFFECNERPTAGRLVSLLAEPGRSPSTSTAQDECHKFWSELREKSRVQLHSPDVPAELLAQFAQLASDLWDMARSHADRLTATIREDARAEEKRLQAELVSLYEQTSQLRADLLTSEGSRQSAESEVERLSEQVVANGQAKAEALHQIGQERAEAAKWKREADSKQEAIERLQKDCELQQSMYSDLKQAADGDRTRLSVAEAKLAESSALLSRHQIERSAAEATKAELTGQLGLLRDQLSALGKARDAVLERAIAEEQRARHLAQSLASAIDTERFLDGQVQKERARRKRTVLRRWHARRVTQLFSGSDRLALG